MTKEKKQKTRFGIYLSDELVEEAKRFQQKFAKADNLSGLIENLLRDFIKEMKEFESYYQDFTKEKEIKK